MKQEFAEFMSKRTDEELIEIVKVKRADYQPEALEAAEKELGSRHVNFDRVEQIRQELTETKVKKELFSSTKVSSWIRLIHFVVDLAAFLITAMILGVLFGLLGATSNQVALMAFGFAFFLYFVFMEYKFQKTIGKFLTKTKVVLDDGQRPALGDVFIRTACRLIPFDNISYLFTSNGLHDRFSRTTVVKD